MAYLSSAALRRARGGYGTFAGRRGGLPLIPVLGSWLGGVVKRTVAGITRKAGAPSVMPGSAIPGLTGFGPGKPGQIPNPGVKGTIQRVLPGGSTGYHKRRRMNVANPKALRRAIRRTDGFVKLARRTLKGTGFTVARRGLSRHAKPARKR